MWSKRSVKLGCLIGADVVALVVSDGAPSRTTSRSASPSVPAVGVYRSGVQHSDTEGSAH